MEAPKAVPVMGSLGSGADRGAVWVCVSWLSQPWDVLECFKQSQKLGTALWIEKPQKLYLLSCVWQAVTSPVPAFGEQVLGTESRVVLCPSASRDTPKPG